MEELLERLFAEGVAHESQWTFPSRDAVPEHERRRILDALRKRFGPRVPLIDQLPPDDRHPFGTVFYDITANWFYRLLDAEGYDPEVCAFALRRWLSRDINTLVLCGGRLSNAKRLFNLLCRCFPLAVCDAGFNDVRSIGLAAPVASLYCLPFVDRAPDPLMLHFMEGNPFTARVDDRVVHVPAVPVLVHLTEICLANSFTARNTCVLFLTGDHRQTPVCREPRRELRDFIYGSNGHPCRMTLLCKRDNRHCADCLRERVANE